MKRGSGPLAHKAARRRRCGCRVRWVEDAGEEDNRDDGPSARRPEHRVGLHVGRREEWTAQVDRTCSRRGRAGVRTRHNAPSVFEAAATRGGWRSGAAVARRGGAHRARTSP